MGCDIHLIAEVRNGNGTWHLVPNFDRPCDRCEATGHYPDGRACYRCKGEGHLVDDHYSDRSYDVFAMLADVRNGSGFAGVVTGEGFLPLAPYRGIPEDIAEGVYGWDEEGRVPDAPEGLSDDERRYEIGEHSFTWLTYDELQDEDYWKRETTKRGVVSAEGYQDWKRDGRPHSWSGGISGPSIRHVDNEEMERLIAAGDAEDAYTEVWWRVTYREQAQHFLERIRATYEHAGSPDPKDFRLTMGFDS